MTSYLRLMGIFTLILIALASPINAKITEIKTECGLFDCYSIFDVTANLVTYKGSVVDIDIKTGKYLYGDFVVQKGSMTDVKLEVVDKSTIKISGKIQGATQNLWGFSMLGDASHLNSTWWNSSYNYRFNITIPAGKVTANLTSFPLLVSVTVTNLSDANADGSDIAIADNSGNQLLREIEYFNQGTGQLIMWANASLNTQGSVFWIYYNSTTASNSNSPYMWNPNYKTVIHLNGTDNLTQFDSTSNSNSIDGSKGNASYYNTGKIWKAVFLDGTGDYLSIPHSASLNMGGAGASFTVSIWANRTVAGNNKCLFMKATGDADGWRILWSNALLGIKIGGTGADSTGVPTQNVWQLVTLTYDGANARLYYNGVLDSTTAMSNKNPDSLGIVSIGAMSWQYPGYEFGGFVEEFRLETGNRSQSWINASYQNQVNPSAFYTVGGVELQPHTVSVAFVLPTPENNVTHGFDYDVVINVSVNTTGTIDTFSIEWSGTNYTLTNGVYIPTVIGGRKYSYQAYCNLTTGEFNYTETRILFMTALTEAQNAIFNNLSSLDLSIITGSLSAINSSLSSQLSGISSQVSGVQSLLNAVNHSVIAELKSEIMNANTSVIAMLNGINQSIINAVNNANQPVLDMIQSVNATLYNALVQQMALLGNVNVSIGELAVDVSELNSLVISVNQSIIDAVNEIDFNTSDLSDKLDDLSGLVQGVNETLYWKIDAVNNSIILVVADVGSGVSDVELKVDSMQTSLDDGIGQLLSGINDTLLGIDETDALIASVNQSIMDAVSAIEFDDSDILNELDDLSGLVQGINDTLYWKINAVNDSLFLEILNTQAMISSVNISISNLNLTLPAEMNLSAGMVQNISNGVIYAMLENARILNERVVNFHNSQYCIDNMTLQHNITYDYCIGDDCRTMKDIMNEECTYGCDYNSQQCIPSPFVRWLWVFIFIVVIFVVAYLINRGKGYQ